MASSLGSLEERHQNASGLGEGGKEMGKRSKAVDRRGQSHAPEPPSFAASCLVPVRISCSKKSPSRY